MRTPPKSDVQAILPNTNSSLSSKSDTPAPPTPRIGCIPINSAGHRLDTFLRTPSNKEYSAYNSRTRTKKLCTSFYLTGSCRHAKNCRFNHKPISPSLLHVLGHKLKEFPCHFKGACRNADCFHGHMCIKKGCSGTKVEGSRFGREAHGVDLEVAEWVPNKTRETKDEKHVKVQAKEPRQIADGNSSTASMENWPTKFGILIDI
jgi:hypothetical protein